MSAYSYYLYILKCADNSYYTGVTNDLTRRVFQHQQGLMPGCYTYTRRPIQLVYAEEGDDIGGAIFREKQIKRWSRKKKEALIAGNEALLGQLAQRYTPNTSDYVPHKHSPTINHHGSRASP